jgi:uroporphyrinogen decarboxylase
MLTVTRMTSLQRLQTALNHQEPDRVPFMLAATFHGAKALGLSIREYFSCAENVVEGQWRIREKFGHDGLVGYFYSALELEAWGSETIFVEDGPPNAGQPVIRRPADIYRLQAPRVKDSRRLCEVLKAIQQLKERAGGEVPVMGAVISPFSLPIMQMGYEHYLDLIYADPDTFQQLMRINEEFCVEWANAQFDAGADAISYADPLSSPTMIPRDLYLRTGFPVARRTIGRIKGSVAASFASARTLRIVEEVVQCGAIAITTCAEEDLAELKAASRGRLAIMGNLNTIEMRRWSQAQAEGNVKRAIAKAGRGGGYVLSDVHGEIPWQVPDDVLLAIAEAVRHWGQYPLKWVEEYDG